MSCRERRWCGCCIGGGEGRRGWILFADTRFPLCFLVGRDGMGHAWVIEINRRGHQSLLACRLVPGMLRVLVGGFPVPWKAFVVVGSVSRLSSLVSCIAVFCLPIFVGVGFFTNIFSRDFVGGGGCYFFFVTFQCPPILRRARSSMKRGTRCTTSPPDTPPS